MNIEYFIRLVRQRPCLYDAKHPSNKNKQEKDRNWKEIASALNVSGEVTRKRWRNLKDTYSKHLKGKQCPKNHPASKYWHWQWASHMEFMKQHLCLSAVDDLDAQSQSSSDAKLGKSHEGIPVTRQRSNEKPPVLTRRRHIYVSRPEKSLCKNTDKVLQYMDLDATELIFLGYAKTIKSFSIRRQAQIKMKIARIMMEEEVAHFEESECGHPDSYSPSPQHNPYSSNSSSQDRSPTSCRDSATVSFSGESATEPKLEMNDANGILGF